MDKQKLSEEIEALKKIKDPFEKGKRIKELIEKHPELTYKALAKHLGMVPSHIAHYIRLLKLPELIIDGYYSGSISLSHLFVISRLKKEEDMINLYEEVLKNNLSVQQTEEKVRLILHNIPSSSFERYLPKQELKEITNLLKEFIGEEAKVKIIQTRIKTRINIEIKAPLIHTNQFLRNLKKKLLRIANKNNS